MFNESALDRPRRLLIEDKIRGDKKFKVAALGDLDQVSLDCRHLPDCSTACGESRTFKKKTSDKNEKSRL